MTGVISAKIDSLARSMERYRPKEHQPVSLAEAAKTYAEQGWPVFPLVRKISLQRHTRLPGRDKVLEERYGTQFRNTRIVRSAHGGLHLYYQHPRDGKTYPNAVKLGGIAGIDVRGDGGYVVLPPSKLYNSLSYQWGNLEIPIAQAPDWLLSLLQYRREQKVYPQESRFAERSGSKWLTQALQEATEGNRNLTGFHLACQLRDDGLFESVAAEIMLAYAQQVPQGKTPYTVKEALASLRSAYRRPPREKVK